MMHQEQSRLSFDPEIRKQQLKEAGLARYTPEELEKMHSKLPVDKHFKFGELRKATFRHCNLRGVTVEERNGNVITLEDLYLSKDVERVKDVLKGTIIHFNTVFFSKENDTTIKDFLKSWTSPTKKFVASGLDLYGWNQSGDTPSSLEKERISQVFIVGEEKEEENSNNDTSTTNSTVANSNKEEKGAAPNIPKKSFSFTGENEIDLSDEYISGDTLTSTS